MLLVEQPGPWGRAGLRQSRFDAGVAAALEARAGQAGIRVLAVRRPGRTPRGLRRRWALADTGPGAEALRWGAYDRDEELLELPLDGTAGQPDHAPLYLVCTHSRHDTCCALRGRPVAAALARERPGRVWECSHLGGERFAANVLLLPSGLLYGRVLPFAAPEFVAAAEADEVVPALLRGRVGLPPAAQAALAFGYDQLALRRRAALTVARTGPVVDGTAEVDLLGVHGGYRVSVRVETVAGDGLTCANPGPNHFLSYQPVRIERLDTGAPLGGPGPRA